MGQVSSLQVSTSVIPESIPPSEITVEERVSNLGLYNIMSFCNCQQLYDLASVNKGFNKIVHEYSERSLYCDKLGPDIWEKIGEIDEVPPIPEEFSKPRIGFNLVLIPEYITIEVDENSGIALDESFEVGGKKARLIENPHTTLIGTKRKKREIKVPLTLNNIIFLFQKFIPEFEGIDHAWQNILDQHGDVGVGPSHWSYQRKEVFGHRRSYQQQVNLATGEGFEIVSLTDRILFHLLSYMKTGQFPQKDYSERTSTTTLDDKGNPWQSALWWPASGPSFFLYLSSCYYDYYGSLGAVAGVPAGSSPATE